MVIPFQYSFTRDLTLAHQLPCSMPMPLKCISTQTLPTGMKSPVLSVIPILCKLWSA
uniref:Uncharacterized protein n=1 Tax=Kalanchoe fedtschenkoi TaxID=63787 RepID=A0A7N0VK01_KALFE